MAAIDYGTGPNTSTGDLMPVAIGKLRDRLAARGFDPGSLGSDIASALAKIETAAQLAEAAYTPGSALLLSLTGTPPAATVGVTYSFIPNVAYASGPVTFTLTGTLPAGLEFDSATGAVTGTPTAATTAMFTIGATDSKSSVQLTVSLTVGAGQVVTPAPIFTTQPTVTPASGTVGQVYTATAGIASNTTGYAGQWFLNGTAITGATVLTYTSAAAGSLTYRSTATGPGGSTPATSAAVMVVAVVGVPTIAFANPTASVTEGDTGTKTVSNTINVDRQGVTGALTINLTYGGTATSGADYVAGPVSLTLADGVSSGSFDLTINGDTVIEANETIIINAALSGYSATASKTITLTNDDVSSGTLTPYTLQPETQAFAARSTADGVTPSMALLDTFDTIVRKLKASTNRNAAGKNSWEAIKLATLPWDTEAQATTNIKSPTGRNLRKVGAPTYTPRVGFSGFATTAYYDTDIPLSEVDPSNFLMGVSPTGNANIAAAAQDIGVIDTTASFAMTAYNSTGSKPSIRAFNTTALQPATGGVNYYDGLGWTCFSKNAGVFRSTHHGIECGTIADQAAATPTDATKTISLGYAKGSGGGASTRTLQGALIMEGATAAMEREVTQILNDALLSIQYGYVMIYPVGVGPTTIDADVVISGWGPGAAMAAYNARKLGLTVAMVGDAVEDSRWCIGGHEVNGLTSIDAKNPAQVRGTYRDLKSFINNTYLGGRTNSTTQVGLSAEPRAHSAAYRRMFDPTRNDTVQIPGVDGVIFYATGGITSVQSVDDTRYTNPDGARPKRITSVKTADGRTFTGRFFVDGAYDGDLTGMGPVPSVHGRGVSVGGETVGGYRTVLLSPQNAAGGTQLVVDPYITPGTPASGYIYGVIADPNLASGADDPNGLQSMNKRQTWSNVPTRYAPLATADKPPVGYNPAMFEGIARMFAAGTAAGTPLTLATFLKIDPTSSGIYDINNGECRYSTDRPNSGLEYYAAGFDNAARKMGYAETAAFNSGLFHWMLFSGDSRIPAALLTELRAYSLDPLAHLDSNNEPKLVYRREPYSLMRSSFIYNTTDIVVADGTTPRSIKTVAEASYALDLHSLRTIEKSGALMLQGAFYSTNSGGADNIAPLPLEAVVPNVTDCTNLWCITTHSASRLAYGTTRMEPVFAQLGQTGAYFIANALQNNVALQAVDYPTVRNAILNPTYGVSLLSLRQVN